MKRETYKKIKDKNGNVVLRPNNTWDMHYYNDPSKQHNVYTWYDHQDFPTGAWKPRSYAGTGEYYKAVQNKKYYKILTFISLTSDIPSLFSAIAT